MRGQHDPPRAENTKSEFLYKSQGTALLGDANSKTKTIRGKNNNKRR